MSIQIERERLLHAAAQVRWWPAAIAFLIVGLIYAVLPDSLTIGPPWVLLLVVVLGLAGSRAMRWRGMIHPRRYVVLAALGVVSIAVTASAVFLINSLVSRVAQAETLLRDAAVLWLANVLTFALVYWETDGGGPAHRHASGCGSTDFAFPQRVLDEPEAETWSPEFVDYLFLAFNTSTAFSPTDTMVLARRAKGLMMWQSVVSLVTIAVLAARAINTI